MKVKNKLTIICCAAILLSGCRMRSHHANENATANDAVATEERYDRDGKESRNRYEDDGYRDRDREQRYDHERQHESLQDRFDAKRQRFEEKAREEAERLKRAFDDENEGNYSSEAAEGLEIPAPLKDRPEQIVARKGYTMSYNKQLKVANWVAWHLTASHTSGPYKRKGVEYLEDMDVPSPRSERSDYWNSGWDRGHQCPSGDSKWDRTAQQECFYYSNMTPQNHDLNGGAWNDLEIRCRDWAREFGDIYIVTGPIFRSEKPRTIGRNKVAVPDAYFKVVLCMRGTPKALGFIYENKSGQGSMQSHVVTVDKVEEVTGIDFFPSLDKGVEKRVESQSDWKDW